MNDADFSPLPIGQSFEGDPGFSLPPAPEPTWARDLKGDFPPIEGLPPGSCLKKDADSGQRIIELPFDSTPELTDAIAIDSLPDGTRQTTLAHLRELLGGGNRGVDVLLNIQTTGEDNWAEVEHDLGSESLLVSMLTTVGGTLWTNFGATWQIQGPDSVRFSFAHEFSGPARAIIQSANILP